MNCVRSLRRISYRLLQKIEITSTRITFLFILSGNLCLIGCAGTVRTASNDGASRIRQLSVSTSSINFGQVVAGRSSSQTVIMANTGDTDVLVSRIVVTGIPFSLSGLTFPISLLAGQTASFNVTFSPTAGQVGDSWTGSTSISSNASSSPSAIALSGTTIASTLYLTASPGSLNFGSVSLGDSSAQAVTLTNSGDSEVGIFRIQVIGGAFSASPFSIPFTLSPGQRTSFSVVFSPVTLGANSGKIEILSTASSSPINISAEGAGSTAATHSVSLSWDTSTAEGEEYFIYRGTQSGGPYRKLNEFPVRSGDFTDASVESGITYFFVVTAVNQETSESEFSDEISVTIPSS